MSATWTKSSTCCAASAFTAPRFGGPCHVYPIPGQLVPTMCSSLLQLRVPRTHERMVAAMACTVDNNQHRLAEAVKICAAVKVCESSSALAGQNLADLEADAEQVWTAVVAEAGGSCPVTLLGLQLNAHAAHSGCGKHQPIVRCTVQYPVCVSYT
jgi:hypothetical protein